MNEEDIILRITTEVLGKVGGNIQKFFLHTGVTDIEDLGIILLDEDLATTIE